MVTQKHTTLVHVQKAKLLSSLGALTSLRFFNPVSLMAKRTYCWSIH